MNKYVRRMLDVYENIARTYEYRLETFDEIVEEYVAKKIQKGNLSKFIVYECGDIVDDKVNFFYAYKGNFSFIFGDYSEALFATKATIFQDFNSKVFLNEV